MAKARHVRVVLDFVLDMNREFDGLPHELHGVVNDVRGVIVNGLRRTLPRRSNASLMPSAKISMKALAGEAFKKRLGHLKSLPPERASKIGRKRRRKVRA